MAKFTWSATSLQQALTCPYQYFLERKAKIEVPTPAPMVFGSCMHRMIGIAHKGPKGNFRPTSNRPLYFKAAAGLIGFWKGYWYRKAGPEAKEKIAWRDPDQFWQYMALGMVMLGGGKINSQGGRPIIHKGYFQSILKPPLPVPVRRLRIEEPFDVKFWDFPVIGKYDQIWELADGRAVIVDITTGWSKEVKRLQLTIYAKAFLEQAGRLPDMLFVWYLRTNVLVPTKRSMDDLNHLRLQIEHAAASIQDGRFVETQIDAVCRWCRYRAVCDRTKVKKEVQFEEEIQAIPTWIAAEETKGQKPRPKQLAFEGGWLRGKIVKGER